MKTLIHATDLQLVHSFQEGDNQALEVLVNRYKDKIFTSIHILVKDRYLAEDMFQEVFIKIIDKLRNKSYSDEGKFLPWALRVAHNYCIDHFRKVKRTPKIVTSEDKDIFEMINVVEESAEKAMIKYQSNDSLKKIIDTLPDEQREVIVLRHYGDMSFKEIAEVTNTSINTALGRARYGLMNLKKILAEKQIAALVTD